MKESKGVPLAYEYQAMAEAILKERPNLISVPLAYTRQKLNPIIYAERVKRSPML